MRDERADMNLRENFNTRVIGVNFSIAGFFYQQELILQPLVLFSMILKQRLF